MTRSEFIDLIENSGDIMFSCGDHKFTIITWAKQGIGIGFQNRDPQKNLIQYFSTAKELVDNYLVNNIPIGELSDQIIIKQYS